MTKALLFISFAILVTGAFFYIDPLSYLSQGGADRVVTIDSEPADAVATTTDSGVQSFGYIPQDIWERGQSQTNEQKPQPSPIDSDTQTETRSDVVVAATSTTSSVTETDEPPLPPVPQDKPRLLLVVGHTADAPGAEYGDLDEYDFNLAVAQKMQPLLSEYEVVMTHDMYDYSKEFADLFAYQADEIDAFIAEKKEAFFDMYEDGGPDGEVNHNVASAVGIRQLYGINYWIEQNDIDVVFHVHFNDYAQRRWNEKGEYEGFAFYIPKPTNNNHAISQSLAIELVVAMNQVANISNLPVESDGILATNLIATGSYNSVAIPAVLGELGYIYEDKFADADKREIVFNQYARVLALGLNNFARNFLIQ